MEVKVLSSYDGYQAVYVDGLFHDAGNPLGEGCGQLYFLKLSEKFERMFGLGGIKSDDISFHTITGRDQDNIDKGWPGQLDEFLDEY